MTITTTDIVRDLEVLRDRFRAQAVEADAEGDVTDNEFDAALRYGKSEAYDEVTEQLSALIASLNVAEDGTPNFRLTCALQYMADCSMREA